MACHPRSPMNVPQRQIYDQEYGFHMKDEVMQTKDKTLKESSNETQAHKP
jgi:hypothetical protein